MMSSMRPNNPLSPCPTCSCHNQITKPSEVRSLSPLRSLLSLTLACNPVDSKPKAMRTLCMGLLPSLTSLDGVKIIRVASVKSPAKGYSQLYSRGRIAPGKGSKSKQQKAGMSGNLADLQPLFTIKPSGSSMPSGSFPVRHQVKECNLEGVSYSPRQWLESILQDAADLHGLQVTAAALDPPFQSTCRTSYKTLFSWKCLRGSLRCCRCSPLGAAVGHALVGREAPGPGVPSHAR